MIRTIAVIVIVAAGFDVQAADWEDEQAAATRAAVYRTLAMEAEAEQARHAISRICRKHSVGFDTAVKRRLFPNETLRAMYNMNPDDARAACARR